MPTGPRIFLKTPGTCGLRPCAWTHLKKALWLTHPVGGRVDKYRLLASILKGNKWSSLYVATVNVWYFGTTWSKIKRIKVWRKEKRERKKEEKELKVLRKEGVPFWCQIDFCNITLREVPWCNCHRRRKWTWWHKFKPWMRLIVFHIALIPLGKVISNYSPSSYRYIVGQTRFFSLVEATSLGEGKLWIQTC